MFTFTLGNYTEEQVYFHCSVALCRKDPVNRFLCPGQCVPRKQRIGDNNLSSSRAVLFGGSAIIVTLMVLGVISCKCQMKKLD
ncbi:hypothetical protein chiPu_0022726 [Chiloscyllium punctatum]|uniref:ZP domain-containing protein n=1 Tax=Chiloscyllium punctatum TaxID=137246 RepID=A0A401T902_CHIPU|nr:hypothetical protein [Chiloscyllium punctatum]